MDGQLLQTSRRIRTRLLGCGVFFSLLLCVVLARAVHWQLTKGRDLTARARRQYVREKEIQPRRGDVVDRNGAPLATSVEEEWAYIAPDEIRRAREESEATKNRKAKPFVFPEEEIARVLDVDPDDVHALATGTSRQLLKKKELTSVESARLHALKLENRGLDIETRFRRFYPNTRLASHVLGVIDIDGRGVEGIEKSQDELLSGDAHAVRTFRDIRGTMLQEGSEGPQAPPTGAQVQLTIDSAIQDAAEKALLQQMATSKALAAEAIVMDPYTGAILALANVPDFNPNKPGDPAGRKDRAVNDSNEPGSVMKCFVVAGALTEKLITPEKIIDVTGGELRIGRRVIHDDDQHSPDHSNFETVREVIAKSSNVGAARIGLLLGPRRLTSWYKAFGFGERTNIELPAEAHGVLQDPSRMGEIGTATSAFGQGMTASGVQVVTALSAIANGGTLMRPYIVQKVTLADGDVAVDRKPEAIRRVLSPEVARTVTDIMIGVTRPKATGPKAAIEGIEVAGKTGTAQIVDPATRKYGKKHFASFMGFAPADNPRVAIYVAFDSPEKDTYGGEVAAPAFKAIAMNALFRLGVDKIAPGAAQVAPKTPAGKHPATVPPIAVSRTETESLDEDTDALSLDSGDDDALASVAAGSTIVPDLHGCSARSGLRLLHDRSLEVELEGAGRVLTQRPEAGRQVPRGTRVHLTLGNS
jgi:cell division protein FtsI (penicillin-binding protein 3)